MIPTLGLQYTDRVSGFTGTAVSSIESLRGSPRVLLRSRATDDGQIHENWFECGQVEPADETHFESDGTEDPADDCAAG